MNPPAKASPAPFVSMIAEAARGVTGYTLEDAEVQTMVEEEPWVMMTVRGVAVSFGELASAVAIVVMSLVYHVSCRYLVDVEQSNETTNI